MPPNLSEPYGSDAERFADRAAIVIYNFGVEYLLSLAEVPADAWTSTQMGKFPDSVAHGSPEHPQQRLRRWASLYREEVDLIRKIRDVVVHGLEVPDADLRGAVWLARQIISTAIDRRPSDVDSEFVRKLVTPSIITTD